MPKKTTIAMSLLATAMLLSVGCSSPRHVYLLGEHVMSQAEKNGEAPLPRAEHPPGDGEIFALTW